MSSEHEEVLEMVRYISQVAMKYDTPIDNVGVLQIMHGIKFTYSLTYSLTHLLTHSLTHLLTHSLFYLPRASKVRSNQ